MNIRLISNSFLGDPLAQETSIEEAPDHLKKGRKVTIEVVTEKITEMGEGKMKVLDLMDLMIKNILVTMIGVDILGGPAITENLMEEIEVVSQEEITTMEIQMAEIEITTMKGDTAEKNTRLKMRKYALK